MPPITNLIYVADASDALRARVNALIAAHEHEHRKLAWVRLWGDSPALVTFVVVGIDDVPVGLVTWTGPADCVEPSWWIADRGKRHGKRGVEQMAKEMVRRGVLAIRDAVTIDALDEGSRIASKKLVDHLRLCFERERGSLG